MYKIGRTKTEFRPGMAALNGQLMAVAVQVAVAAEADAVLREQGENFRAFIAAITRRIVQEAEFFPLPCGLERGLQPDQLTTAASSSKNQPRVPQSATSPYS